MTSNTRSHDRASDSDSTHANNSLLEHLTGTIERVTFHSEDSGFCVIKVKVKGHRDPVAVTGKAAMISAGEFIDAQGVWITDTKFGLQFKAQQLKTVPPNTIEGIQKYLGSGMVKGVGPHFANILVSAFGADVFDVIEQTPEKLEAVPGLGKKRISMIIDAWGEQKTVRDIMVFLQGHGIGTAKAVRIYKVYGNDAVRLLEDNPYRLAQDIHGIGFKTADQLAGKMGVAPDSLIRAQAGVRHVLQLLSSDGHCAAARELIAEKAAVLLQVEEAIVAEAIDAELSQERLIEELVAEHPLIYLPSIFYSETSVAKHIIRLMRGHVPWEVFDTNAAAKWLSLIHI